MPVSAKHIVSWPGQRGAQAQTSWTQALHTCRVIALQVQAEVPREGGQ